MITADSTKPTRFVTYAVDTMPARITEPEFEKLHAAKWRMPPPVVRTRQPMLARMWRALTRPLRRRFLAWRERCIVEERQGYAKAGVPMGPTYLKNCAEAERDLRSRQAMLDLE